MENRSRVLCTAFIAGLLVFLGAPASAQSTWVIVPSPNAAATHNTLNGVDGVAANDAWAVGTAYDGSVGQSLIMRWNGAAWSLVNAPQAAGSALGAVDAVSTGDVWAVGSRSGAALALRWNGRQWAAVPTPNVGPNAELSGVTASSASEAWAIGSYAPSNGSRLPFSLRWNGGQWSQVPVPRSNRVWTILEDVDGSASTALWAVGSTLQSPIAGGWGSYALRWTGSAWQPTPLPVTGNAQLHGVEVVAPNDVWAVGEYLPSGAPNWVPLVLHWNGSAWRQVAVPNFLPYGADLADLVALSPTNLYAVGVEAPTYGTSRTLVLHWNGSTWSVVPTPTRTSPTLSAAAAIRPSTVWAVGGYYDGGLRTLTLRTDNG